LRPQVVSPLDGVADVPAGVPIGAGAEVSLAALAGDEDPALGLVGVVNLRQTADACEQYQVARARAAGWSWAQIGAVLEVSAKAVHKKHARRLSAREG
jgi:hypothetical protein